MSGFDIGDAPGLPRARLVGERLAPAGEGERAGTGLGASFVDALRAVDRLGDAARGKAEALARGEAVEAHELMVAMGKSEVAFNLMLEVRNKLVEAWHTLSRSVT